MNRSILSFLSAASLALASSAARAQEHSPEQPSGHETGHETGGHGGGDYPTAVIDRPLELPKGMLELQANVLANLGSTITVLDSSVGPFKPVFVGFGLAYGVDGHLQLGVSSRGLCLTGDKAGCDRVFDDIAVDGAYGVIHQKGFEMSLQAAVEFNRLAGGTDALGNETPSEIAGGIGVDLKSVSGQFAVRAGPKLLFGLKERTGFNREFLVVPLDFIFQATPQLALGLGAQVRLLLDPPDPVGFGDYLVIPVSLSALFAVDKHLDLGAQFTFTNLLGKHIPGYGGLDPIGFDGRGAALFAAYRL